jgi:hypothetical protein
MEVTMISTAKGILSLIDNFLSSPDIDIEESQKLWDVLVALRGPDKGGEDKKYATTSIVRKTAFPKTFMKEFPWENSVFRGGKGAEAALGAKDTEYRAAIRRKLTKCAHHHFNVKQKHAFKALGLKWEEKN